MLCLFETIGIDMTENKFEVEGRTFRTKSDYERALCDKQLINQLRKTVDWNDKKQIQELIDKLKSSKIKFHTILGEDFMEEVEEKYQESAPAVNRTGKKRANIIHKNNNSEIEAYAIEVLKKKEKRRRIASVLCGILAIGCLGYFAFYSWQHDQVQKISEKMNELREQPIIATQESEGPLFHLDAPKEQREVLDEYKNLLIKNKKLIGWVKIDDTYIDYPVVQTYDNEYYLDHNFNQEYDKNGSIFLDKDCDIEKPSTNLIIYGHHMKSGAMFGGLNKYEKETYYNEHPYIQFDTIYEKGVYQVMYVFRSRVYKEDEIVFKYYQFIDAGSEQEFLSNMKEMEKMSLYDTGVTASYGDQLLTLSTCDYQEKNGRFVVVAKKIKE